MRLLIKPGAQISLDPNGKGNTAADESNLTGESHAVGKSIGDSCWPAPSISGCGRSRRGRGPRRKPRCKKSSRHKGSQQRKAPAQQFTDKVSTY